MLRFLLALALSAALWLAGQAGAAATALAPCGETPGLLCGSVDVPLDRTGRTPGTISLHVEELPPTTSERGVMFLLAGGPGQGSAHAFQLGSAQNAAFLRFLFPDYTLVAFDDRGTGESGLITCPQFQASTAGTADQQSALVAACATAIGPARRFYSTADHAEDIEAVRQALGLAQIGLFGVSYGTKLALAYALAHPDEVDRLLLDSVLETKGPDPYGANVVQAVPAKLAAFCSGGLCAKATPSFPRDVATLANRLESQPLQAKVLQPSGASKTVRMTGEDLLSAVIQGDLSPGLAAELPAAVRAALRGDPLPLARAYDITVHASTEPAPDLSAGLYAATTCDDGLFPWTPETPVESRPALLKAAVAALPTGTFGPFGSWAARLGPAQMCLGWPSPAGGAPLASGPLPDVPMLAISGGLDMRTPTASALAVASQFPQGHVLVVPGVGHSVLTTDLSFCSQRAVRSWVAGGSVPDSCPRVAPLAEVLRGFPDRTPRTRGPDATASIAAETLQEAVAAWLQSSFSSTLPPVAGLAGGTLTSRQTSFRLTRYALVPDVALTGTLTLTSAGPPFSVDGSVRVSGAGAAAGTLTVAGGKLTGVLGGHSVHG